MVRKGTWRARLDELGRRVGRGALVGGYSVDQRYAAKQHVEQSYNHPRGGGPNYVSTPLRARHDQWFKDIADGLLAGHAPRAMADAMDDLDQHVRILAPLDENDLRRSGRSVVTDDGQPHYERGPDVPRLTDAELRAKARRRSARGRG